MKIELREITVRELVDGYKDYKEEEVFGYGFKSYDGLIDYGYKHHFRVKGVRWFTNLDHKKRYEKMELYKWYEGNEKEFPKYDNYDAINVDKTKEIPRDYKGAMGVPITFLDKYNPAQFEILGQGQSDLCDGIKNMTKQFVEDYYKGGGTGSYKEGNPLLGYYDNNGKATIPYMRIIIKNKVVETKPRR